ncbi:hypothetical protein MNBD_GAMMA10-2807 [hydrothermal vent metagenome]|uniref:Lipoprotein n=1 Tax=hydrothermal vent metagenome TaxID=652676 RepID=A0A3B0YC98_9ZZZZ
MKIFYFMVMLFALSACGSDKEEPVAKDESPVTQKSTATDTTPQEDTAPPPVSSVQKAADEKAEKDAANTAYDGIVYIETGAVQCQAAGVTHEETAQLLINNDIEVLESKCASLSGVSVIAQCGGPGLDINIHIISPDSHARALSLGFKSTASLKQDDDPGYTEKDCESVNLQYP